MRLTAPIAFALLASGCEGSFPSHAKSPDNTTAAAIKSQPSEEYIVDLCETHQTVIERLGAGDVYLGARGWFAKKDVNSAQQRMSKQHGNRAGELTTEIFQRLQITDPIAITLREVSGSANHDEDVATPDENWRPDQWKALLGPHADSGACNALLQRTFSAWFPQVEVPSVEKAYELELRHLLMYTGQGDSSQELLDKSRQERSGYQGGPLWKLDSPIVQQMIARGTLQPAIIEITPEEVRAFGKRVTGLKQGALIGGSDDEVRDLFELDLSEAISVHNRLVTEFNTRTLGPELAIAVDPRVDTWTIVRTLYWAEQYGFNKFHFIVETSSPLPSPLVRPQSAYKPHKAALEDKKPAANPDAGEGAKAKKEEGKVGKKDAKMDKSKGNKVEMQQRQLDREVAENAGVLGALRGDTDPDYQPNCDDLHDVQRHHDGCATLADNQGTAVCKDAVCIEREAEIISGRMTIIVEGQKVKAHGYETPCADKWAAQVPLKDLARLGPSPPTGGIIAVFLDGQWGPFIEVLGRLPAHRALVLALSAGNTSILTAESAGKTHRPDQNQRHRLAPLTPETRLKVISSILPPIRDAASYGKPACSGAWSEAFITRDQQGGAGGLKPRSGIAGALNTRGSIDDKNAADPVTPAVPVDTDKLKAWQHASAWHGTWTRREGGKMYTTYKINVQSVDMSQKSPVLGGRLKITSYYEESDEEINCAGIPRYEAGVHTLALFEVGGKLVPRRKARKASKGSKASATPQLYDPRHCATLRMFKGECFMDKFRVTCPN